MNFQGPHEIEPETLNIDSYLKHKRQTIEIFLQSVTRIPSRSVSINNINSLADNINPRMPERSLSFSTNIPSTSYQSESMVNLASSIEPIFCNSMWLWGCKVLPLYSIEQLRTLNGNRRLVGQLKLNEELSKHVHPKSRKMSNNKLRNTEQTFQELLEHYKFFHNLF